VFNLSVEEDPTFFVGEQGILVHNAKCKQNEKPKRNFGRVAIGRIMNERVKPFARMFGHYWYAPRPPVPPPPPKPKLPTVDQNKRWIRKQMRLNRVITDVGPGPATDHSDHYLMELTEVENYRKRGKLTGRKGRRYPHYQRAYFPGVLCENGRSAGNIVFGDLPDWICRN
jgi:hypothetical protein